MKKKIVLFIIVIMASQQVQAQNWQPVSAVVSFNIKMLGINVLGNFKGLAASVKFDPAAPENGSIAATVDAATIDTDNKLRNSHLREKEEFFDTTKYPKITMKSTKIEKTNTGYLGYFDLTIKNTTRSVKLPFTFTNTDEKGIFKGSVVINRRDWKVGGGTLGMSNDVTISLTINTLAK